MSDEMNNKIKQIAKALGQEDMSDNLVNLISAFANSVSNESSSSKEENSRQASSNEINTDLADNIDMVRKFTNIMSRINSINDPRINLLHAIKPFLNSRRQSKLNNCVNILRMSSAIRLIDESEKGS
jgi:hypothetical protein